MLFGVDDGLRILSMKLVKLATLPDMTACLYGRGWLDKEKEEGIPIKSEHGASK